MLRRRHAPEVFPDPDQPLDVAVRAIVDWGLLDARMCNLPVPDPKNPTDVADMTAMVGNYFGIDAEHSLAFTQLVQTAMTEYRPDYLLDS